MTLLRLDLPPESARRVRALLVPEIDGESRLLVLVQAGRAIQAVRTDLGPLRDVPPDLHSGGLERARTLAGPPEVERLVTLELDQAEAPTSLLDGLLRGSIRADPPWVPALDRVRGLPAWVRRWAMRLLPDGAYGVALPDLGVAVCARVGPGPGGRTTGATALSLEPSKVSPKEFVTLLRRRFGRPQLGFAVHESVLRTVLASRRPITALDRAVIRGEARIATASLRVRLALLVLRLLGA